MEYLNSQSQVVLWIDADGVLRICDVVVEIARFKHYGGPIRLVAVVLADLAIDVIDPSLRQRSQQNDAAVVVDMEILLRHWRTALDGITFNLLELLAWWFEDIDPPDGRRCLQKFGEILRRLMPLQDPYPSFEGWHRWLRPRLPCG